MVSKCANPACATPFRYYREGRLFCFRLSRHRQNDHLEHFWLCGACAARFTLVVAGPRQEVVAVPRAQRLGQKDPKRDTGHTLP